MERLQAACARAGITVEAALAECLWLKDAQLVRRGMKYRLMCETYRARAEDVAALLAVRYEFRRRVAAGNTPAPVVAVAA